MLRLFLQDFCLVPVFKQRLRNYNHIFLLDWFSQQTGFSTRIEEMEKIELGKCLEIFYLSARQKDGGYYKATTLRSIRAGLDRYLQSTELKTTV